jgi:hypothetical protein
VAKVKVRWFGMAGKLATREDLETLKHQFPVAPAFGSSRCSSKRCHSRYFIRKVGANKESPSQYMAHKNEREASGPEWE